MFLQLGTSPSRLSDSACFIQGLPGSADSAEDRSEAQGLSCRWTQEPLRREKLEGNEDLDLASTELNNFKVNFVSLYRYMLLSKRLSNFGLLRKTVSECSGFDQLRSEDGLPLTDALVQI